MASTKRPDNYYPAAPRPEWFMRHVSNLQHASNYTSTSTGGSGPGPPPMFPVQAEASFVKMDASQYSAYLLSLRAWEDHCVSLDSREHDRALVRRAVQQGRESTKGLLPEHPDEDSVTWSKSIPVPGYVTVSGQPATVDVTFENKVAHEPQLSTKPHQAEKRANKALARNAITKAKANHWKAVEQVLTVTEPVNDQVKSLLAVKHVTRNAALHKVELSAAKQAAKRANVINKSSPDHVANVDPSAGQWTVVTRKKGEFRPQLGAIIVTKDDNGNRSTVANLIDPSVKQNLALPHSAIRQPTQVGGK